WFPSLPSFVLLGPASRDRPVGQFTARVVRRASDHLRGFARARLAFLHAMDRTDTGGRPSSVHLYVPVLGWHLGGAPGRRRVLRSWYRAPSCGGRQGSLRVTPPAQ